MTTPADAPQADDRAPVIPRIMRMLAPYKTKMVLVGVAVVISAALTSLVPFLTRAVFDDALFRPDGGAPRLDLLAWLVGGMIAIPVVTAGIGITQNWLTSTIGNSAMADLRGDLFAHLQKMELAFFTGTKTGVIQSRLANDVSGVRTVLTDTATTILQNSVTVIAAFVSMVILSWQLTILALVLMPVFVYVQVHVGRRRQRVARRTQESLSEMSAITEEALSVSGILLAKVFNRSESEVERYRGENRRQTRLQVQAAMTGRTFFAVMQTFFAVTPALVYLLAGLMLTGGSGAGLTAGTLVAFTTLQARLQMPLLQLMRVSLDVQTSLALFRRIFEYLDLEPAITERPGAVALDPATVRGEVELRDVWFRYPEPRELTEAPPRDRFASDDVHGVPEAREPRETGREPVEPDAPLAEPTWT
ncbi:ABC transporter ATP-binding protein, partial [Solicola sp. PLA-1-18]|uniref:ABC transporter ATP-binding protein n=1 Tax=Solicola sp. PLA-1-18 TaxID=3380532 RepID=UPI003B787961